MTISLTAICICNVTQHWTYVHYRWRSVIRLLIEFSHFNWYFIVCLSMLWCNTIASCKGEGWYRLTRCICLHLFQVRNLMSSGCRLLMWFISVSGLVFFKYRLDRRFSILNGFILVIFWALYNLLFGVSQGTVLKTVLWPIMVYFYKLLLGWRVFSFALIPHLVISMLNLLSWSFYIECRKSHIDFYTLFPKYRRIWVRLDHWFWL